MGAKSEEEVNVVLLKDMDEGAGTKVVVFWQRKLVVVREFWYGGVGGIGRKVGTVYGGGGRGSVFSS